MSHSPFSLARWGRGLALTLLTALGIAAWGSAMAQTAPVTATALAGTISAPAPAGAPAGMPAGVPAIAQDAITGVVRMENGALLAPEFARIASRGELVVAVLGVDQPPFFEEKNGQLKGFDIDFAHEIARKLGVRVRFNREARTFDGVVTLLAQGQADIAISKLSRTLSRARVISFSAPYLSLKRALLLNRVKFAQLAQGRSVPEVVRAYTGSIGVVANSSYADYVGANFPKAKVRTYPTWPAVLTALDAGEIDAAYRDEFEVKRVLKADPTASLRLRVVTLQDLEDTLGIAVNASDQALLGFVNLYLADRSERLDVNVVLQATNL